MCILTNDESNFLYNLANYATLIWLKNNASMYSVYDCEYQKREKKAMEYTTNIVKKCQKGFCTIEECIYILSSFVMEGRN